MREEFEDEFGFDGFDDGITEDEMDDMLWCAQRKAENYSKKKTIQTKNTKKKKGLFW